MGPAPDAGAGPGPWFPIPHHLGYLHDALCALAPPDHQCSHEQRDRNGESNERAQNAVGRVPQGPARDGALAEVAMVDSDEESVHFRVGPETTNLVRYVPGAVSELPIAPVDTKRSCQESSWDSDLFSQRQSSPFPPPRSSGLKAEL